MSEPRLGECFFKDLFILLRSGVYGKMAIRRGAFNRALKASSAFEGAAEGLSFQEMQKKARVGRED